MVKLLKSQRKILILAFVLPLTSGCFNPDETPSTIQLRSEQDSLPTCQNGIEGRCIFKEPFKSAVEPNLQPSLIAFANTIFGIAGTYLGPTNGTDEILSGIHHVPGAAESALAETQWSAGQPFSAGGVAAHAVPRITQDDDGVVGGNVTYVQRAGWGSTSCGLTQNTLEARIEDCFQILGAETDWDGRIKGNAGQGRWRLVTRTGDADPGSSRGREVWRDERTGLLWSSLVSGGNDGKKINWCKASGANNILGNLTAQVDPGGVCDNGTHQNVTGLAISACFESVQFTDVDPEIDRAGKADLGLASTPLVAWRIPTLYDVQTANINGYRFVLPDMGVPLGSTYFWLGTLDSYGPNSAWEIQNLTGDPGGASIDDLGGARCVGR